jgi:hypothetical protein
VRSTQLQNYATKPTSILTAFEKIFTALLNLFNSALPEVVYGNKPKIAAGGSCGGSR